MNIKELLIQPTEKLLPNCEPVCEDEIMVLWESALEKAGFNIRTSNERNTLTDATLTPNSASNFINETPVHIKLIGRHMNGSFRCHIGTSKASRAIKSTELCSQMRLLAVFFRTENAKSKLVSPEYIFFPTWLLHLFRYTKHGSTPGRTDVRFLENEHAAKEDHIYRLNHVINTLFRFNIRNFDPNKLRTAIELANFLFDRATLEFCNLPKPIFFGNRQEQPALYSSFLLLLYVPRPEKNKPMCLNCNTKPASRRKLCVACYRYELKHNEARPLRLIVANRPGPRVQLASQQQQKQHQHQYQHQHPHQHQHHPQHQASAIPMVLYSPSSPPATPISIISNNSATSDSTTIYDYTKTTSSDSTTPHKFCANCNVQVTHQWYRNLCGQGHWCETCKSYFLRHSKVRPSDLFVKAAKRKVDFNTLFKGIHWSWDVFSPGELDFALTTTYALTSLKSDVVSNRYSIPTPPSSSAGSSPVQPTFYDGPMSSPMY